MPRVSFRRPRLDDKNFMASHECNSMQARSLCRYIGIAGIFSKVKIVPCFKSPIQTGVAVVRLAGTKVATHRGYARETHLCYVPQLLFSSSV